MKGLKIIKAVFGGIVFVAVAVFILAGVVKYFVAGHDTVPSVADAPWLIQTTSRVYYGAEFSLQDGVPSLKGYWTLDGKKYNYHSGVISFPETLYGTFGTDVKLVKRTTQKTTIIGG